VNHAFWTMLRVAVRHGWLALALGWSTMAPAQTCDPSILGGPVADETMINPHIDVRSGGVLAESYAYHHQGSLPYTIMPPGGAYRWGFPVSSYRWGWFGAERYYPRVAWRYDYHGDCIRWAYRYGY